MSFVWIEASEDVLPPRSGVVQTLAVSSGPRPVQPLEPEMCGAAGGRSKQQHSEQHEMHRLNLPVMRHNRIK